MTRNSTVNWQKILVAHRKGNTSDPETYEKMLSLVIKEACKLKLY